jgi:hypothetical protein
MRQKDHGDGFGDGVLVLLGNLALQHTNAKGNHLHDIKLCTPYRSITIFFAGKD